MSELKSLKQLYKKFQVILTKSQKGWAVILFILTAFGALFEALGVSAVMPLIGVMIEPDTIRKSWAGERVLAFFPEITNEQLMLLTAAGVIAVYIAKNMYMAGLCYVRIKYSCKVQRELSVRIMHSYVKRGYPFFLSNTVGDILRGCAGSVAGVYMILSQFFRILAEILTILCICGYLIIEDAALAGTIIVLALFCVSVTVLIFRKKVKYYGEEQFKYNSIVSRNSLQLFYGIKEVLVMKRTTHFLHEYEDAYIHKQKATISQTVATESPAYIIEGTCVAGIIIAVCVRVLGLGSPMEYLPQLSAFAMAAFRILPSLGRISSGFNTCIFYVTAADETYHNILELNKYEERGLDGNKMIGKMAEKELHSFAKSITVENVVWEYEGGTEPVLNGLDLEIKKGQAVAFIGHSGAGKTTLGDVILGLLEPQKGRVCIDGIDIREIGEGLGKLIGFVPQSIYMTDDTIRNNIAFGIDAKNIDDERIYAALEKAHLKEFVEGLPAGLNTLVGERGIRMSGGQRQRLAIARALYLDPQILVLDEATSALDAETETAVMESIDALQGEKTLIIIAHRLSTIRNCDAAYEIVNGKAVERSIDELVRE
ncbi:MAG: ABC transporter ATP-binding protein/permease [Lachnospiraceae bacterium]|nr:ABC transporter ATP-binding protein/permease [Lachnospiraceae bacterium]